MEYFMRLLVSCHAEYQIYFKHPHTREEVVVWRQKREDNEDLYGYAWPLAMRKEYERLTGEPEFDPNWDGSSIMNIVEALWDSACFNQSCKYGNLCDGHAVYCHNDGWLYAPRKCKRTWYTGGEYRDEDCPGFAANSGVAK